MRSRGTRGRPPHPDTLTTAEWRVVEAVRHGMTNPGIARRLGVSTDAVKYHVGNALHKLGFSSRRDLRLWHGIRRDSSLLKQGVTMDETTVFGAIGQIGRTVKDIAAARQWYGESLGLEHLYSFGTLAFFNCGGVRLMLTEGEAAQTDTIIYFRVADIRSSHETLSGRGVEFVSAPHLVHRHADGTEEWMAFFNDNEGRKLAIMAQVRDASASPVPAS